MHGKGWTYPSHIPQVLNDFEFHEQLVTPTFLHAFSLFFPSPPPHPHFMPTCFHPLSFLKCCLGAIPVFHIYSPRVNSHGLCRLGRECNVHCQGLLFLPISAVYSIGHDALHRTVIWSVSCLWVQFALEENVAAVLMTLLIVSTDGPDEGDGRAQHWSRGEEDGFDHCEGTLWQAAGIWWWVSRLTTL